MRFPSAVTGTYPIGDAAGQGRAGIERWHWGLNWNVDAGIYTAMSGTATLTSVDPDRRIIEGRFSFDARDHDTYGGSLKVTGGRFRLRY